MGIVSSRPDDGSALYLKDQNRFSITSLSITNPRRKTVVQLAPNSFPASKITARREGADEAPVEFVQDPEAAPAAIPSFLLRLNNDDEIIFNFSIVVRQVPPSTTASPLESATDTVINGLTFIFASNTKDLDVLVTREFHADPNLHKNSNVELVNSEISTGGSPSIQLDYTWKWRPPKQTEDKVAGWRNTATFVEYDQRAHRLNTLATFSFWVQNTRAAQTTSPTTSHGPMDMLAPPRIRVASSQSYQSVMSDSEGPSEKEPPSPVPEEASLPLSQQTTKDVSVVDVNCARPGDDVSAVDDGPLFRATIKSMEQKTSTMKMKMKKVLKRAEAAQAAQGQYNEAASLFIAALKEASGSNANAVQPALDHYFDKIAKQILRYESQNTENLQKLIIEPLSKVYNIDIKAADFKKKDFEDESKDYYAYVSRYLGQRQDSMKEKKRIESDSKYQSKRRNFELKRFDYSSYMQDLHGGRKEQEVLSHLTKYADTQSKSFLATSKKIEDMLPQLDALIREVGETDKEYQIQRREREEKRRNLEKNAKQYVEPEPSAFASSSTAQNSTANGTSYVSDSELSRSDSTAKGSLHHTTSVTSQQSGTGSTSLGPTSSVKSLSGSPFSTSAGDRFKGIRDLEERPQSVSIGSDIAARAQRKEGLLWALSRPGSHVDPRGLNKQAWHKFWIVLDQGKLSEYSNWKERLDLHMEPIDLRLASVREARSSERRFCFEVITPNFKRVYQATSEEDMNNWITAVNNALQSAFEGRGPATSFTPTSEGSSSLRRDIGSVLTGKSPSGHSASLNHHTGYTSHKDGANSTVGRRTTVGARPSYIRTDSNSYNENPMKLLEEIRARDAGNAWCADCNSDQKVEWVSINLGIILCIECSGIHRSLGTHVSKIRSLTLDTVSFTHDIVEIIMQIGNRLSNQIWEARLDQSTKPGPQATRDQRLRFITDKYVERVFVQPLAMAQSHYATPDDTLLASVKKDDIRQVLYALALKANPNAADKSRNTHAVFLAMAAADPASPHPTVTTTTRLPQTDAQKQHPPAFPVAELLLQNGGEIPSTLPAFPLSSAAKLFFDQRSARNTTPTGSGDTLTALPSFSKGPGSPADKDSSSKLQKRGSSGARFGGRVPGV